MHTKAFPFQHVTNYPIAWLHTRSGGGGRGSYKTSRQAQICCSINTLLKSHLARSPGCLVTRCNRSPSSAHSDAVMLVPGPPQDHWDSQMEGQQTPKTTMLWGKSLLLLRAATSQQAVRLLQPHQISVLRATKQGLSTQRLKRGKLWPEHVIFINTADPATAAYPTRLMSIAIRF